MSIPNTNEIHAYLHCINCLDAGVPQKLAAGWTKFGLQVWCEECDSNILHVDFESQTHPANVTRQPHE